MTREQALAALTAVSQAVLATVEECPQGAPLGPMYQAFQEKGMPLSMFEAIITVLIEAGKVRRTGHLLYPIRVVH